MINKEYNIDRSGDVEESNLPAFTLLKGNAKIDQTLVDPDLLFIFGHRVMQIVEKMGWALQNTPVSVIVKERLDFSCTSLDPKDDLVNKAPRTSVDHCLMSKCFTFEANH